MKMARVYSPIRRRIPCSAAERAARAQPAQPWHTVPASLHAEDDLAHVLIGLHQRVCPADLVERQARVDDRLQRAGGDGRMAAPSQRVRFQEPCVLSFFAGVDIHSRERPLAIGSRLMVLAVELITSRTRTHLRSRLVDRMTGSTA